MNDANEKLGLAIDRVANLAAATELPMPDHVHVQQLKALLPEVLKDLRAAFVEVTGENPWLHFPKGA